MENCKSDPQEAREKKHIKLDYSIEAIGDVKRLLSNLLEEIVQGQNKKLGSEAAPAPEVRNVPSLADVLHTGPEKIFKSLEEMKAIISDIRSNIF